MWLSNKSKESFLIKHILYIHIIRYNKSYSLYNVHEVISIILHINKYIQGNCHMYRFYVNNFIELRFKLISFQYVTYIRQISPE